MPSVTFLRAFTLAAVVVGAGAAQMREDNNTNTTTSKAGEIDPELGSPLGNSLGHFPPRSEIWSNLLKYNPEGPYRRQDPPMWGKGPVSVGVSFKIMNMVDVNEKGNTFTLDLMFRLAWNDERLKFDADALGGLNVLILSESDEAKNLLWKPDVTFSNVRSFTYNNLMGQVTRISTKGDVLWSRHMAAMFGTTYNLRMFPFDYQYLPMYFDSYKYSKTFQEIDWAGSDTTKASAIGVSPSAKHSSYKIYNVSKSRIITHVSRFRQDYIHLESWIVLKRDPFNFIVKMILPIYLIILMSTVGYQLDAISAAPARTGLAMTCVLTQVAFSNSVSTMLPKVAYLTWMDYYLLVALLTNVSAMFQFSFVLHNAQDNGFGDKEMAKYLDEKSQIVVPVFFTVFTLIMLFIGTFMNSPIDQSQSIQNKATYN